MSTRGVAAALAAGAAYAPAVLSLTPLRRRVAPGLSGLGTAPHSVTWLGTPFRKR